MTRVSKTDRTLAPVGYRLGWISLLIFGLLLLYGVGVVAQQPQEKSLPRFFQVNEHLYRGAQPLSGGIGRLAELGIKTVINLRGDDEETRAEEDEAQKAKLRYFNIPLPGLSAPKDRQVDEILAIINDPKNWPVFVHCNHGKDRTGTIVAVYRISHDGWTGDEAKAEAKRFGLSWVQVGMKHYIGEYYEKHKPQESEKSLARPTTHRRLERGRAALAPFLT